MLQEYEAVTSFLLNRGLPYADVKPLWQAASCKFHSECNRERCGSHHEIQREQRVDDR